MNFCHEPKIMKEPNEIRFCHHQKGHTGKHETIYLTRKVEWDNE
jgi:hypothetical protein